MNRRNFFKTLTGAVAGFAILPPATTYSRIWKATRPIQYRTSLIGVWEMMQSCKPLCVWEMSTPLSVDYDKALALMFRVSKERRPKDRIEIIVHPDSVRLVKALCLNDGKPLNPVQSAVVV